MNATKSVTIIVATHKQYEMPEDVMYLPLHVGAEGKYNADGSPLDFSYIKDNTGDNISAKNSCFGSQTGLYWAWKHIDADYLGLVHYRRYFVGKAVDKKDRLSSILTYQQLLPMLDKYKVFVPQKRRYYIETLYSHYAHTLDGSHLDLSREILEEKYPTYLPAFDRVMKHTYGYMFNMMIMRKDLINDYRQWLFDVLFTLEKRVDMTNMTDFEKRFCGRVSEILFNVWLEYQVEIGCLQQSEIKELPFTEDVNWPKKVKAFLMAKFFHKKVKASF